MRQLLFFSPPPASADAFSVVVDQLELAAAGGLLGCGVAAAVWVAGTGSGAVEGEESLREPNQRVRRFPPLLALLGCSAPATEVLQAPGASASPGLLVVVDHCGEAPAVRVGAGSGGGAGAAVSLLLLRPKLGNQLLRSFEALACLAVRRFGGNPKVIVELHGDYRTAARHYGVGLRRVLAVSAL